MSANSAIVWSDRRWNLVRGCSKISPGCKNCQAETYAERFRDLACYKADQIVDVQLVPQNLLQPLHWLTPSLIFVNSMGDLFHEEIPDHFIVAAFEVMALVNWHVYQVLTKRIDRMQTMIANELQFAAKMDHIWWGVSVEDTNHGVPRIEALRNANVAKRFLSVEPLLEDLGTVNLDGIDWVLVGDERGRDARPIEADWVLSLRDQCVAAKVPFFFKHRSGFSEKKFACLLDGKEYKEAPSFSSFTPPPLAERRGIRTDLRIGFYNKGIVARFS